MPFAAEPNLSHRHRQHGGFGVTKGLPAPVIAMTVALGEAIRAGECDAGPNELQRLLGREPLGTRSVPEEGSRAEVMLASPRSLCIPSPPSSGERVA